MVRSLNAAHSELKSSLTTQSVALSSNRLGQTGQNNLQTSSASLGTRSSRREIGVFDRVFTTSGSVRRNFTDVYRFELSTRRSLRIYLGNQFSNPNSSNRRMVVDLFNDSNLRRISSVTINPTRVDAITQTLSAGVYRIRVSTQSNDRGRYFLDMVRL
jgi:hypothetical protein